MEDNISKLLKEVKETQIHVDSTFTLGGPIGIFDAGEKVVVKDKRIYGNDVKITLSNEMGKTDVFYLDKNDDFEELIS